LIKAIQTGPFSVNSYIVKLSGSAVFITDPAGCKYCGDETKIIDYLNNNNLCPIAIILTHGHFDHISGLSILKSYYPNIPILINKNDSLMIGPTAVDQQGNALAAMGFTDFIPSISNLPSADDFLTDKLTLDKLSVFDKVDTEVKNALNNWIVLHTPGHTPGGICLYNEKEKYLITGDTIFYQSYGRTDLPGGNQGILMHSLNKIYSTIPHDVSVFPGHDYYGFTIDNNL